MNPWGHLRTIGAHLRRRIRPAEPPAAADWSTLVADPQLGSVRLTGRLSTTGRDRLLVAVHGLGGSAESHYLWELAATAVEAGWAVLRLNLRGADRSGEDFYHGGLTADLHAALADDALAAFSDISLVGYSLGGHAALRWATEAGDPRVRAVGAVCPPLDLAAGQRAIDRPGAVLYRGYILRHLREIYREVASRRAVPLPVSKVGRIRSLWEWDDRIVAPRYGFEGAAEYYARASVAPRLDRLRLPALIAATSDDPMVPASTLRTVLADRAAGLEVRWIESGGHVAFPRDLDMGFGGRPGLGHQMLAWLEQMNAGPRGQAC